MWKYTENKCRKVLNTTIDFKTRKMLAFVFINMNLELSDWFTLAE
jgi:hypothetical protein